MYHDTDAIFDLVCCAAFWAYVAWQLYRRDRRRKAARRR